MLSTSQKIRIARAVSASVLSLRSLFGLSADVIAQRRGVTWSLDLTEGIDLAIYVLGGFELRTLRQYAKIIREGDTVLDIGANIGAHTLPLAQLVGKSGRVFSFEPTAYAFEKQLTNIAHNPMLAARITTEQMMLTATDNADLPDSIYSSWPLESADDLHSKHHGRLMDTCGASRRTLDSYVRDAGIQRVSFIKLDVDGNENNVLAGARAVLRDSKPKIMLELAPYVYGTDTQQFDELLHDLWGMGYQLSDMATGKVLPSTIAHVRAHIPASGGLNVLAQQLTPAKADIAKSRERHSCRINPDENQDQPGA